MAKESSSSLSTAHTVFLDTNLGTHMVMMVTDEDTVGDFKKKVSTVHHGCFPNIGEITVHSLKVRRNVCFYHLSNSMLVKSAFDGVKKSWFLHVDAASSQVRSIKEPLYLEAVANFQPELFRVMNDPSVEAERGNICIKHISTKAGIDNSALPQAESSDLLNKLVPLFGSDNVVGEMTNVDSPGGKFLTSEHHKSSSLDSSKKIESQVLKKHDLLSEENEVPQTNTKGKKEKSKKRKKDISCDELLGEDLQSGPTVKKPRLTEKKVEDSFFYSTKASFEEHNSGICMSSEDTSKPENIYHDNTLEGKKRTKNVNLDGLQEKEIHSSPVKGIGEGNSILCLSLGGSHGMSAAVGDVDLDSLQDVDMGGARDSKLESGVDTSAKTVAFGARKSKKSKKHQAANANEAEMSVKDGNDSSDPLDASGITKTQDLEKKRGKKSKKNMTADANEAEMNMKDELGSSTPLDTSDTMEAVDPGNRRGKKSKKNKDADAKGHLHAHSAEDIIPLPSNREKSFDGDHQDVGINEEAGFLSQTENRRLSKVCSSDDYIGTDDNDKNEGEKALLQNEGPKMAPEAMNTMLNIKVIDVSVISFDAADATEAQDLSDKRKKKSKKTKASNAKSKVSTSGVDNVESAGDAIQLISESQKALVQDYPSIETKKEDNILSQTEGQKASKLESLNPPSLGFDDKDYQGSGHGDHSLQLAQIVGGQEITDNIDDKVKRKSIKPPASTSNTVTNLGMKQRVGNIEDPPLSTTGNKEEEKPTAKKMRKSKSKKGSSVNQSYGVVPEAENGSGFRSESLQHHQLSGNVGSPQTPTNAVKYNVGGQSLVNGSGGEAKDHMEVPKSDGDEVNFRHYFVPKNDNHELVAPAKQLVEKDVQQRENDNELKVKKKTNTHNVHSVGTTELEKPHDSINNQGLKKKTQSGTSDTSQLQRSKAKPHSNGNVSISAGERLKTTLREDHKVEAFPDKVSRNKIVGSSEDIRSQHALKFCSPSSTVNVHTSSMVNSVAARKPYIKKTGDVLNSSQDRKSFVSASNTNFSESSTESYEDTDEGENHNSDASTRSPSDMSSLSSSSDHSEGESKVDLNSPGSGVYGRKVMDNGGKRSIKSKNTVLKGMDLDAILRSSRSYKKAKLTASQSQPEETGSEPIQFNLDSQA